MNRFHKSTNRYKWKPFSLFIIEALTVSNLVYACKSRTYFPHDLSFAKAKGPGKLPHQ